MSFKEHDHENQATVISSKSVDEVGVWRRSANRKAEQSNLRARRAPSNQRDPFSLESHHIAIDFNFLQHTRVSLLQTATTAHLELPNRPLQLTYTTPHPHDLTRVLDSRRIHPPPIQPHAFIQNRNRNNARPHKPHNANNPPPFRNRPPSQLPPLPTHGLRQMAPKEKLPIRSHFLPLHVNTDGEIRLQ